MHLYIDSFDEGLGIDEKKEVLISEYISYFTNPKILISCRSEFIKSES